MDLSLKPTVGFSDGETIQFALGRWPDRPGKGVALCEEAFDLVEPHLLNAWKDWDKAGRYGVTELPPSVMLALAQELHSEATVMRSAEHEASGKTELFSQLADWLAAHGHGQEPVSIFGF